MGLVNRGTRPRAGREATGEKGGLEGWRAESSNRGEEMVVCDMQRAAQKKPAAK